MCFVVLSLLDSRHRSSIKLSPFMVNSSHIRKTCKANQISNFRCNQPQISRKTIKRNVFSEIGERSFHCWEAVYDYLLFVINGVGSLLLQAFPAPPLFGVSSLEPHGFLSFSCPSGKQMIL